MGWQEDMIKSAEVIHASKQLLKKMFDCTTFEIYSVEGDNSNACTVLDKDCGIDYILKINNVFYTAAWRSIFVKKGEQIFSTFTLRKNRESGKKTEYDKRKEAIENGSLYPHFHIQAHVDDETKKVLRLGIVKTKDLMNYIDTYNPKLVINNRDQKGQTSFYSIEWSDMRDKNYNLTTYYLKYEEILYGNVL